MSMILEHSDGTRIIGMRLYIVGCTLPEAQGNASGWYDKRGSLIVELVGESGASGWGETWHSPQPCSAFIRGTLAPVVLGSPASNPRALTTSMRSRRGYDRGGISSMAISAIEMAAWDLTARVARRPIAALLGGAVRTRLPVYAAGPYFKPGGSAYRDYALESQSYARAGFRALKAKIGIDPRADAEAIRALRAAVGGEFALMVDANQGGTSRTALDTARRIAEHDVLWYEEPVPPEDLSGYARFATRSPIACAGGEALGELAAFGELIRVGADIVQPDLSICGGFGAALDIAALVAAEGVALVPHVWGTGINLHATLQLLAVLPESPGAGSLPFPWLELDRSPNPLRTLWGEPSCDGSGNAFIPDGPGLGVEILAADLEPYVLEHWSLSE